MRVIRCSSPSTTRNERVGAKSHRNDNGCEATEVRVYHAAGEHPAIGKAAPPTSHAFGYVHPGMGVGAGAVSPVLYHPSTPGGFEAVNVGGGRVVIVPVGVYCGMIDGAPAPEMETGGQGNEAVTLGGTVPAPSPPVCHGRYSPLNGDAGPKPSAAHLPLEVRGSLGIQPLSRPSL